MTGEPGRPPVRAGLPIGDLAGGMWAVISILSALRARDHGLSEGSEIDVSLLDGQIAMIPYFSAYYFLDGFVPGPQGSGGHSPTYGAFKCADGRYVIIAVVDQKPWQKLCSAFGREDLEHDPRFSSSRLRATNQDALRAVIDAEFAKHSSNEWQERLKAADVAYARVNRLEEALADPQVLHRNMVVEINHTLGDTLRFVGNPVKLSDFTTPYDSPPIIGEHTEQVLRSLGVPPDRFADLRERGIV